jgi:hypothetical protein
VNGTVYPNPDTPYVSKSLAVLGALHDLILSEPTSSAPLMNISVLNISDTHNAAVFRGDGTIQHPDLTHREVLVILPVQMSPTKMAIIFYVMSRNSFLDMPPEDFQVTLGGLPSRSPKVSCHDVMMPNGSPAPPCAVVEDKAASSDPSAVTFTVEATDYPRVLILDCS